MMTMMMMMMMRCSVLGSGGERVVCRVRSEVVGWNDRVGNRVGCGQSRVRELGGWRYVGKKDEGMLHYVYGVSVD